ncbi:DUF1493 family protein [Pantoea ananatis]|uniref:DUF1493 family protein n=1 Tax=Pantoea ananas TaxID=553 RepID=UPI001E43BBAB|nr:DUF1493 family protein [Pantoea ananatis]
MDLFLMDMLSEEIITFVRDNYARRRFIFWGQRHPVTPETSLRDDLKLTIETAGALMHEYFERWNVESLGFDIRNYVHPELPGTGDIPDPHKPLTVSMLIDSARAGRWLFP